MDQSPGFREAIWSLECTRLSKHWPSGIKATGAKLKDQIFTFESENSVAFCSPAKSE